MGVLKDSTDMDYSRSVVLNVDAGLAYVTAALSDTLAIVDVGTDPTNPTLVGVLQDSTSMYYASSVALDISAGLAYAVAYLSGALTIADVGTDPTNPTLVDVLQDFTNRHYASSVALNINAGLAYARDAKRRTCGSWRLPYSMQKRPRAFFVDCRKQQQQVRQPAWCVGRGAI